MRVAVIGLDIGSTGCKCIIFDDDAAAAASAYLEYPKDVSGTTIRPQILWDGAVQVIRQAVAAYQEDIRSGAKAASPICSIGISSFGESFVVIDAQGNPLDDIMLYTDARGLEECDELIRSIGEKNIMKTCGVKPHPMYSLAKIAWIRNHKPEVFAKAHRYLLVEDYIIYKLTGSACIDYSLAARTMAFDVIRKRWDSGLLAFAGISERQLSVPVPSGSIAGPILPSVAKALGLDSGVLAVTGGHDQVCAAVGAGIFKKGTAIDGIGTVECITPVFDTPILSSDFLGSNYCCVPYAIPGMYVTYAFNFTGGSLLKWFRDHFASAQEAKAKAEGIGVYQYLDEHMPSDISDILIIPHFAGSGTPDMNPNAAGLIANLTFRHGSADLYKAMLEAVTFEMKYNMDRLAKSGVLLSELSAVGGGSKSVPWLTIKASITGCRMLQLEVEEAGINGAAMLASVATGRFSSLQEAAKAFIRVRRAIEPSAALSRIYQSKYEAYCRLRDKFI